MKEEWFLQQWDAGDKTVSRANLHKPQVSHISGSLKNDCPSKVFLGPKPERSMSWKDVKEKMKLLPPGS